MMTSPKAKWPLALPEENLGSIEELYTTAIRIAENSPYGWGHSIQLGSHHLDGVLKDNYLAVAQWLDDRGWWPGDMSGLRVADVGCFTGGLTAFLSSRNAATVYAVDEIGAHLDQCRFLKQAFHMENVDCIESSAFTLNRFVAKGTLDLILLSGVLYHMSDMLVGLVAMQELLKEGGVLIIESHAVPCFTHSYANFGRFVGGMWWQPTAACIKDLCEFSGLGEPEIHFYTPNRCLARCVKRENANLKFKRGMHWPFTDLADSVPRSLDYASLAPADCSDLR